jgi:NADP-dependent 3-hydroxy acid dehydrogenase YdfG
MPAALITPSTGIGAETARMLAGQGWSLFVASRTAASCEALAVELRSTGADVLLNAWVQDVETQDNGIRSLIVATKLDLRAFTADGFIVASGVADLCHFGGFDYELAGAIDPAQTLTTFKNAII